jgi:hypothetical protein
MKKRKDEGKGNKEQKMKEWNKERKKKERKKERKKRGVEG